MDWPRHFTPVVGELRMKLRFWQRCSIRVDRAARRRHAARQLAQRSFVHRRELSLFKIQLGLGTSAFLVRLITGTKDLNTTYNRRFHPKQDSHDQRKSNRTNLYIVKPFIEDLIEGSKTSEEWATYKKVIELAGLQLASNALSGALGCVFWEVGQEDLA